MDYINEIAEEDRSIDTLIKNSIDLIQYARQLTARQVNIV